MKSRILPDKKMLERTKELAFKDFFIIMQKNKALDLIAMAKFFGIGKKRIAQYLDFLAEFRKTFDEWEHDGVFELKARQELENIGIDYNWLMDDDGVELKDFKERKEEPTFHEAVQAKASLAEYAKFMESVQGVKI